MATDDKHRHDTGPDELLERLVDLRDRASTLGVGNPFELYHRRSLGMRVVREPGYAPQIQTGREDGMSLRVHGERNRRIALAAVSGSGEDGLDWLVERLRREQATRSRAGAGRGEIGSALGWADGPGRLIDHDQPEGLPTADAATAWIARGLGALDVEGRRLRARIEVAATFESWASSGGRTASRARTRAWAIADPPPGEVGARAVPLVVASRGWASLPGEGWKALRDDRRWPAAAPSPEIPRNSTILFGPEAAATLVATLARSVHGPARPDGLPVGPGWRLDDDPRRAGALMGGAFDDSGFPTSRKRLANGRKSVARLAGRGHDRRPSYRDLPGPAPCHLVVEERPVPLPPCWVLASTLAVHRLEPESWVLEFDGGLFAAGEPGPPIVGGLLRTTPLDLVRRCVGSYGDAADSHRGVTTPALLFEDVSPSVIRGRASQTG